MALVEIEHLTYAYPDASGSPQLSDCSLVIDHGEIVLVVGESGCGKSTLLRAVNGLVPHFHGGTMSGRVRVSGLDTREHTPARLAHLVACVFQDPEAQIVTSTVYEEVVIGLENLGVPTPEIGFRAHEALGAMNISHLAERSTGGLSGGEMQRVAIAAALAMRPALLVLDEPTSQLDPSAAESLLELLRRVNEDSGIAVLIAEHRLDRCFHWSNRVVVMEDGRIVHDAPPRQSAAWSMASGRAFVPPVTRLFAGMPVDPMPLTVKEGRTAVRRLLAQGEAADASRATAVDVRVSEVAPDAEGADGPSAKSVRASTLSGSDPAAESPAILVRNLRFSYSDGPEVLRGCSLEIERGACVAIMGENGTGKSTLVRHFNGLNRVQSGHVALLGRDMKGVAVEEAARLCAVLGQNPSDYLYCDTVTAELEFSLAHLRPELDADARLGAIRTTLATLEIAGLAQAQPHALSAGQRQRVAIAAMTVADPRVLVLDEPTRGLDWQSKTHLGAYLRSLQAAGKTVVVVTHDVEFAAAYADRVAVMGAGRIVSEGPTDEVLGSSIFLAPQAARVLGRELGAPVVTIEAARAVLRRVMEP